MRGKTKKKQQFNEFGNCLNEPGDMRGRWREAIGRPGPLVVELAAGRCDWALGYAALKPDANVIAIDIKAERLWAGGRRAMERGLDNVRFLRTHINKLDRYFAPGEIDQLWIMFPDPFPKKRQRKHRLTHPWFMALYRPLMAPAGLVQLKTDNTELYEYTLEVLRHQIDFGQLHAFSPDVYMSAHFTPTVRLMTYYEAKWLSETNRRMKYILWSFAPPSAVAGRGKS